MVKLHGIESPDLEPPDLPEDPDNCLVGIQLLIGSRDEPGSEIFQVEVVTPIWLAENPAPRWGAGLLIVPRFSWQLVRESIAGLLVSVPPGSWEEAAISLSRPLKWEFENYQPYGKAGR